MADGCFAYCETILRVTFQSDCPISVLSKQLFLHSSLQSIVIPSSIEMIGEACFEFCLRLTNVTFESESKVSVFGKEAFALCFQLEAICIPSSVIELCESCFRCCYGLKLENITFEPGSPISCLPESVFRASPSK
jgi:hypothetical protein